MQGNKKTFRGVILLGGTVLLLGIYLFKFFSVNAAYPQSQRKVYSFGESFTAQGAQVTLKGAWLLDETEIKKDMQAAKELELTAGAAGEDQMFLTMLEAELYNPGSQAIAVDLTAFHLESAGFSYQFFYPLMLYYNDAGMRRELEKGESVTVKLLVPLYKVSFTEERWPKIAEQDFFLVTSLYPEKTMAEVLFQQKS